MHIILQNGDLLIFAQKVVSKSEGRQVYLPDIIPSTEAEELATETEKDPRLVEMILRESKKVLTITVNRNINIYETFDLFK